MVWNLAGRTAIVTGASSGIGAEMFRALTNAGMNVVATALESEQLEEAAAPTATHQRELVPGDLTDGLTRERIVQRALFRFQRIDLLFNCAGFGQRGPLEVVTTEQARRQLDVNVFSAMELTKLVLPAMRRQQSGRIINVSSMAGRCAAPTFGWYSASKYALEALSDALRLEVGHFGIDVVLIEPGFVDTGFFQASQATSHNSVDADDVYRDFIASQAEDRRKTPGVTAEQCVRSIMKAARARRPRTRYVITPAANTMVFLKWLLPDLWLDAFLRRRLGIPQRVAPASVADAEQSRSAQAA